jgi:RNA polymerase sigma-70 factor (ECF subfamily)
MARISELNTLTDEELVARVLESDRSNLGAFDVLVERHEERVITNCRHISGSPADAPDLAQEVFIKAYFGLDRFEGRGTFKAWVQRIKVNHCLNFLKKKKGKSFLDVNDPTVEGEHQVWVAPGAERNLAREGDREIIESVLDSMADTLRIPLVMRDMDGIAYQEIAEELGIGLSAVKMRIKRAREQFRARFHAEGGVAP